MDFRAQRYRDRLRAEGRSIAMRTARRTRDILDGYVAARKGGVALAPRTQVLWGRVVCAAAASVAIVYYLARVLS